MLTLNNVAVPDRYSDVATLGPIVGAKQITFSLFNNTAYMQIANAGIPVPDWGGEFLVTPTQGATLSNCMGIRFRNAIPGSVARVVAVLAQPADPVIGAGTPAVGVLAATGGVSFNVNIPSGNVLPATPNDSDVFGYIPDGTNFPDVRWFVQWNSGTGFWDFLGGSPIVATVLTNEASGAQVVNVYFDLPTVGPQWTTPNKNIDFYLDFFALHTAGGGGATMSIAPKFGGAAVSDNDRGSYFLSTISNVGETVTRVRMLRTIPASTIVKLQYAGNNGAAAGWSFSQRSIAFTPLRIAP